MRWRNKNQLIAHLFLVMRQIVQPCSCSRLRYCTWTMINCMGFLPNLFFLLVQQLLKNADPVTWRRLWNQLQWQIRTSFDYCCSHSHYLIYPIVQFTHEARVPTLNGLDIQWNRFQRLPPIWLSRKTCRKKTVGPWGVLRSRKVHCISRPSCMINQVKNGGFARR